MVGRTERLSEFRHRKPAHRHTHRERKMKSIRTLIITCLVLSPLCAQGADFVERKVQGFKIYVSKKALADPNHDKAMEHLGQQLFQVTFVLPLKAVKELRRVPIWLAAGEKRLGIAFHPSRKWLTDRGYQPPKPKSLIGIVSGKHFLHEALRQPWLTFHELCHGYDWFTLGRLKQYGNAINADAYRVAMASGKYKNALHWNSRRRKPYHATNKMEFFAETSEAFFGTNDIFPFVRAELRDHDPATYRTLAGLWGVDLDKEHKREADLMKVRTVKSTSVKKPKNKPVLLMIEGWKVYVSRKVGPYTFAKLIPILRRDLHYITRYVPQRSLRLMRKKPIFVHQSSKLQHVSHQLVPHAVVIGNAANYVRFAPRQPSVILRHLAHLHYRSLTTDQRTVWMVFYLSHKSKGRKTYKSVLRIDGKRVRHPGLKDAATLFAELSATRYGTNDHYPFVTAELKDIDGSSHKMLTDFYK